MTSPENSLLIEKLNSTIPEKWRSKYQYKPPYQPMEGTTAYPPNISKAALLLLEAQTPEEFELAGEILSLTGQLEVQGYVKALEAKVQRELAETKSY